MHCVSTGTSSVIPNQFGPQRKNVSSVIRGFKSSVTKNARLLNLILRGKPVFMTISFGMHGHLKYFKLHYQ